VRAEVRVATGVGVEIGKIIDKGGSNKIIEESLLMNHAKNHNNKLVTVLHVTSLCVIRKRNVT
jgi:hypothetical protein